MMNFITDFLWENREWLFSGLGVAILTIPFAISKKRKNPSNIIKQHQNSGDHSTSIQIGKIERHSDDD